MFNLVSGIVQFSLCLPSVNNFFKKNYGSDCLHMLNLNMFNAPVRAAAKVVTAIVIADASRTLGEQTSNTLNDGITLAGDKAANLVVDARRKTHAAGLMKHGVSETNALADAQKKFEYKNTPKSDVRILRGDAGWALWENKGGPKKDSEQLNTVYPASYLSCLCTCMVNYIFYDSLTRHNVIV